MADIQSATAEIREEKRRKKKKPQGKNIMVCHIPYGHHNDRQSSLFKHNILTSSGLVDK